MNITIKQDPSADWTSRNPVLDQFCLGYETDTGKAKMGDGVTAWNSLGYFAPGGATGGVAVSGGGANRVLYEDGSQNLAASSSLLFNGTGIELGASAAFGGMLNVKCANSTKGLIIDAQNSNVTDLLLVRDASSNNMFRLSSSGTIDMGLNYGSVSGGMLNLKCNDSVSAIVTKDATNNVQAILRSYTSGGTEFFKIAAGGYVHSGLSSGSVTGQAMVNIKQYDGTPGIIIQDPGANITRAFEVQDTSGNPKIQLRSTAEIYVTSSNEQMRLGYDSSNYYKTTVSSTGAVTFDAVGSGAAFTFSDNVAINGSLTLSAQNIVTDTSTGMKIGTGTTQKIGFFNATPVAQRSDMGALTDSTGGSASATIQDCTGGDTVDLSFVNDNFASLSAKINAVRTALRDMGIMA